MAAAADRGRGQVRASQADREQTIEVLKTAFVEDRLTKEELDSRVDQALVSRTYAELAAMMPQAGGEYVFLRTAYGRKFAFLYGWTAVVASRTAGHGRLGSGITSTAS